MRMKSGGVRMPDNSQGEQPAKDEYASWDDVTKAAWDNGWKNLAQCRRLHETFKWHAETVTAVNKEAIEEDLRERGMAFAKRDALGWLRRVDPDEILVIDRRQNQKPLGDLLSEEELKWGS
jgi:hypothetical protein